MLGLEAGKQNDVSTPMTRDLEEKRIEEGRASHFEQRLWRPRCQGAKAGSGSAAKYDGLAGVHARQLNLRLFEKWRVPLASKLYGRL